MCLSRGETVLKKLFLDFSLDGAAVNPYMGCRWSKSHFCRSNWLDTSRQMLGGAIPAKLYFLLRGVVLRHPVIRRMPEGHDSYLRVLTLGKCSFEDSTICHSPFETNLRPKTF